MTFDRDNLLESILKSLDRIDYIKVEDIPNIDLYMDQVTTFMEKKLEKSKRYKDDKILTKTMINNYAKNHLLPPPEKKKYGRKHVLFLAFIYYLKNILSINDIQKLLGPLSDSFFEENKDLSLEDIYREIFTIVDRQTHDIQEFVKEKFKESEHMKEFAEENGGTDSEQEFLQLFYFICTLSFDAYVKRRMIETLIDLMPDRKPKKK